MSEAEEQGEILDLIGVKTKESLEKARDSGALDKWLSEATVALIGILQYVGQGGDNPDAIRAIAMQGLEYKKILTEMTIMEVVQELGGSAKARDKVEEAITTLRGADRDSNSPNEETDAAAPTGQST